MISSSLVLFYVVGGLVLAGSLGVVTTRNIVYAALSLLVALIGVAGLFLVALAEFLALVQVLIYGGAIVIVILFTLMLTRIQDFMNLTDNRQWPLAAFTAIVLFGILLFSMVNTRVGVLAERREVEFEMLGKTLFEKWAIPFEIASLVLLVALIGAIVVVRRVGNQQ